LGDDERPGRRGKGTVGLRETRRRTVPAHAISECAQPRSRRTEMYEAAVPDVGDPDRSVWLRHCVIRLVEKPDGTAANVVFADLPENRSRCSVYRGDCLTALRVGDDGFAVRRVEGIIGRSEPNRELLSGPW